MFNKSISAAIAGYVPPDTDRNENSAAVERPDIHDPIETLLEVVATREIRYSVIHPRGYVLDRKNPAIRRAVSDRPLLVVVDQQVHRLYGSDLLAYLEHETNLVGYLSIDGSETAKSWGAVQRICDAAIEAQLELDLVAAALLQRQAAVDRLAHVDAAVAGMGPGHLAAEAD